MIACLPSFSTSETKVWSSRPYLAVVAAALILSGCGRGDAGVYGQDDQQLTAGGKFACKPYRVWDGDTFGCAGGPTVRLAGIAAREVKRLQSAQSAAIVDAGCSPGHPCPATDGVAARQALARLLTTGVPRQNANTSDAATWEVASTGHLLVNGPALQCVSTGSAGGKRVGAFCRSPRIGDLSCAMIRGGYGVKWDRYWRDHRCDH